MNVADAAALIAPAVPRAAPDGVEATWADLGAGGGTFTRALLQLLGPRAHVYALDRDASSVRALSRIAGVTATRADFTDAIELPPLDGVLLANALHFVAAREQADVLARVARHVRPGGRIVLVEYENRAPSRWVPYPVTFARFRELARDARLGAPTRAGERDSAFGGEMWAGWAPVDIDRDGR